MEMLDDDIYLDELEVEDHFEELYEYDLFEIMDDVDETLLDRSRCELEINPIIKSILEEK